ncbi:MAG: hypothetical protein R3C29_02860 [Dehalococcoidia bacterium]
MSARFRLASVVTAWMYVGFLGAPGMVVIPFVMARTSLSLFQTLANRNLHHRQPLMPAPTIEWALFGMAIFVVFSVAAASASGFIISEAAGVAAVLLPITFLQISAAGRSLAAEHTIEVRLARFAERHTANGLD